MRFFIILAFSLFCSCQKPLDDFMVSPTLSRSELVSLKLNDQKTIFASLSPESRLKLYEYKFSVDLKNEELSVKERRLIKKFIRRFVNLETFSSQGISDATQSYWIEKFSNELKWSESDIYMHTMTFMTVSEFKNLKFIE